MREILFIFLFFSLLLAPGCGYSTRSNICARYKTIYVEPVRNKIDLTANDPDSRLFKTYTPLLDRDLTNAIVSRVILEKGLRPVKEGYADLILKTELAGYTREALRRDDNDDPTEYRIRITVKAELVDNKISETLWEEDSLSGESTYTTNGAMAKSDATAIKDTIADTARRVVWRILEDW